MGRIREELTKLKDVDIYSLILFVLFKARNVPELASLSELVYVLDKDNLLKLCEYFGGQTITIPTITELEELVYSLVLYQYVDIDGMPYEEAIKIIGHKRVELRTVKSNYTKLKQVLDTYQFTPRG